LNDVALDYVVTPERVVSCRLWVVGCPFSVVGYPL
jgi:hypothetical protein